MGLLHLHARDPDHHTFETQSWMFDCSEKVREGRRGRNCNTDEARKQGAAIERESVAELVEVACEEVEEDKRSWFMFYGDLVREVVRMTLGKARGEEPEWVDDLVGILGRVVGIPFKTHGWLSRRSEKGHWRSSAGRMNWNERTEIRGRK